MAFKRISIEQFIERHLKHNPNKNKAHLRRDLNNALRDYRNGVKCSCGDDIWVIGSAFVGNNCFTCITGESLPAGDFELDKAYHKNSSRKGQKNIDDMKPREINGFFDDDGYEVNRDLMYKPSLCLTCQLDHIPNQELFCQMTRFDQQDKPEFSCFAYKKIDFLS